MIEKLGKIPEFNVPAIATALGKSLIINQRTLKIRCDNGKIEFRRAPKTEGYFSC